MLTPTAILVITVVGGLCFAVLAITSANGKDDNE